MPVCKTYETPLHEIDYGVHRQLIDYNRMEQLRVQRRRLTPRFARMTDVRRNFPLPREAPFPEKTCRRVPVLPMRWSNGYAIRAGVLSGNTVSPFATMQVVFWSPFVSDSPNFGRRKTGVRF